MENFNFKNEELTLRYRDALKLDIEGVNDSQSFIALLTANIHILINSTAIVKEQLDYYRVLLAIIKTRQDIIDSERKYNLNKQKLELLVRKNQAVTEQDISSVKAKIAATCFKFIPENKQQQFLTELTASISSNT